MPNHVINEIIFEDVSQKQVWQIIEKCIGKDGVDFEILLPLSINFWPGNVGQIHSNTFPGTQLREAGEVWGTKWNAYGMESKGYSITARKLIFTFQTAWTPPYGWIMAIFNTFQNRFQHNYLAEGGSFSKTAIYDYSKLGSFDGWKEVDADEQLHRHLHKLLWGVEEFEDED